MHCSSVVEASVSVASRRYENLVCNKLGVFFILRVPKSCVSQVTPPATLVQAWKDGKPPSPISFSLRHFLRVLGKGNKPCSVRSGEKVRQRPCTRVRTGLHAVLMLAGIWIKTRPTFPPGICWFQTHGFLDNIFGSSFLDSLVHRV